MSYDINIKQHNNYNPIQSIHIKRNGTYQEVNNVYIKSNGIYTTLKQNNNLLIDFDYRDYSNVSDLTNTILNQSIFGTGVALISDGISFTNDSGIYWNIPNVLNAVTLQMYFKILSTTQFEDLIQIQNSTLRIANQDANANTYNMKNDSSDHPIFSNNIILNRNVYYFITLILKGRTTSIYINDNVNQTNNINRNLLNWNSAINKVSFLKGAITTRNGIDCVLQKFRIFNTDLTFDEHLNYFNNKDN